MIALVRNLYDNHVDSSMHVESIRGESNTIVDYRILSNINIFQQPLPQRGSSNRENTINLL